MTTMSLKENLHDYEMRIKETIRQPFIIGGKQIYITLKQELLHIMMTQILMMRSVSQIMRYPLQSIDRAHIPKYLQQRKMMCLYRR